jgi:hypothetical protein
MKIAPSARRTIDKLLLARLSRALDRLSSRDATLLHHLFALAKVTQVVDRLTSSIDHEDLEVDGCEDFLVGSRSGAGSRYLEVFSCAEFFARTNDSSAVPHRRLTGSQRRPRALTAE